MTREQKELAVLLIIVLVWLFFLKEAIIEVQRTNKEQCLRLKNNLSQSDYESVCKYKN